MNGILVAAALDGMALPLHKVPDPVFAQSLVGFGMAITPGDFAQTVVAPISGTLMKLKQHAFVVVGDTGPGTKRGVLVHLGIDTVQLDWSISELIALEGQRLQAGDPVARWNPARVREAGLNPICPVIALDAEVTHIQPLAEGPVTAGDPLFQWL